MRTHACILSACTRVRSYLYQRAISLFRNVGPAQYWKAIEKRAGPNPKTKRQDVRYSNANSKETSDTASCKKGQGVHTEHLALRSSRHRNCNWNDFSVVTMYGKLLLSSREVEGFALQATPYSSTMHGQSSDQSSRQEIHAKQLLFLCMPHLPRSF